MIKKVWDEDYATPGMKAVYDEDGILRNVYYPSGESGEYQLSNPVAVCAISKQDGGALPNAILDIFEDGKWSKTNGMVLLEKDLSDDEDSDVEVKYEFYMVNFSEKSCKKVKSPFPRMKYITNFVTSDDGKSYYISGTCMDGTSGLYYYDCSKDDVKMIMPNSVKGAHVVSFCLIDLDY